MPPKLLQATATGTVIGVVIQESIWLAGDFLTPSIGLAESMVELQQVSAWTVVLILGWLCGGAAGSLMGSLMANGRAGGYAVTLLLALAAWLQLELAWPDSGALSAMALLPLLGGTAGTGIGMRVLESESIAPESRSVPEHDTAMD